jgi:hypothetical protein
MDGEEPLELDIYFTTPQRRLSNEESAGEKQSFWKISVGFAVSIVGGTVRVRCIVVR